MRINHRGENMKKAIVGVLVVVLIIGGYIGYSRWNEYNLELERENERLSINSSILQGDVNVAENLLFKYEENFGVDGFSDYNLERIVQIRNIDSLVKEFSVEEARMKINDYISIYDSDIYMSEFEQVISNQDMLFDLIIQIDSELAKMSKGEDRDKILNELYKLNDEIKLFYEKYNDISLSSIASDVEGFIVVYKLYTQYDYEGTIQQFSTMNDDSRSLVFYETFEGVIRELQSPTDIEAMALVVIKEIKSVLKNPSSLQLHTVYNHYDSFNIELSAQNGFGGYNREWYYIFKDTNTSTLELYIEYFGIEDLIHVNNYYIEVDSGEPPSDVIAKYTEVDIAKLEYLGALD